MRIFAIFAMTSDPSTPVSRYPQVPWPVSAVVQVPCPSPGSGAEIGLMNLRLSIFQPAPLGDFLLAPACPIEKVTLWVSVLY